MRPSADLLLESIARSYQHRAIAVILTGSGTDGVTGIQTLKKMGGVAIAQNKETAAYFGMPGTAIATGVMDFILPLSEIASTLKRLVIVDG